MANRIFTLLLCGFWLLLLPSLQAQDSTLGVSKTKPESGPFVAVGEQFLIPYKLRLPGTQVDIEMIPVPGGVFEMGGTKEDQSPKVKVEISPMWVAKTETSWREYAVFMNMNDIFTKLASKGKRIPTSTTEVDAITAPTPLYEPTYTYEFGQDPALPAVTMTQYAAKQYTKWLSKLTGQQYRLPTETEWEYACRAGASTAYCFGDDEASLAEYAWYAENSDEHPQHVGTKKPNAFGLHDMHGNVMEWTVSAYSEDGYAEISKKPQPLAFLEANIWPEKVEGRAIRGGGFQDFAPECSSSARFASGTDEDWKSQDPNIPLSPWWYTDDPTRAIGFRIFRSFEPLTDQQLSKFWEIDNEFIRDDVKERLRVGRGIKGVVDKQLGAELNSEKK